MALRRIVDVAVPASVAVIAFLHAHAIGALIDATVPPGGSAAIAPFEEARAATPPSTQRPFGVSAAFGGPEGHRASAEPILRRNPFDHVAGSLLPSPGAVEDEDLPAGDAPPCEGVRAAVTVRGEREAESFASLELGARRFLRGKGGEIEDVRVVSVAADRVWLLRGGRLCQARVFGPAAIPVAATTPAGPSASPLERDLTGKIVKSGPTEYQVDRAAMDRLLEAQAELMKTPLVPEKDGDHVAGYRLVRVKLGSAIAMLGLESGDRIDAINGLELSNIERVMEAYARLKTGSLDRLTLKIVRGGKPTNLDYVIR
jgi:general secretion pathway protein C